MLQLISRIIELYQDSKAEDPEDIGISIGSLIYFIQFMQSYPDIKLPSISLTPEKNIYASWISGPSSKLSIHFLPNGYINFVIIDDNISYYNTVNWFNN